MYLNLPRKCPYIFQVRPSPSEIFPRQRKIVLNLSFYSSPPCVKDLGETSGKVLKWHKKEGDIVRHGDTLCDIETEVSVFEKY